MADIRDKHGNPIQLADQHGKPVQLTDEYGNPVHLTAVATTTGGETGLAYGGATTAAAGIVHVIGVGGIGMAHKYEEHHALHGTTGLGEAGMGGQTHEQQHHQQLHHSGSSSSSSSEDDGQGGRRKKKGLKQKIKETLTGGTHGDKDEAAYSATTTVGSATSTTTALVHEKSMMEKIKEKIPGHHH
ncbi:late embryogenesis abundant -like [Olea europaea subsp. europaea]|uniref:Late embryogenesis abundant -like n=1 Tax=Olea europaea subsp. europaea TaxID=158383 RepID=A0A8S0RMM2_OLEEU|nr:late embryogenesis abundant -like [Olea europaea subsp. europaea]